MKITEEMKAACLSELRTATAHCMEFPAAKEDIASWFEDHQTTIRALLQPSPQPDTAYYLQFIKLNGLEEAYHRWISGADLDKPDTVTISREVVEKVRDDILHAVVYLKSCGHAIQSEEDKRVNFKDADHAMYICLTDALSLLNAEGKV